MPQPPVAVPFVAVVGAGPAGLMAAEVIAAAGRRVVVLDRMASPARKLLIAGRGGLNLTHTEALPRFLDRYGAARPVLEAAVAAFPPDALRAWCEGLGQPVFVGSSGRVFPVAFKAAPLLRAWLGRLAALGVQFQPRRRWLGWDEAGALRFAAPDGEERLRPAATVLALGGASWPRLGSDGCWTAILRGRGVQVSPLRPANCGVRIAWSPPLLDRAGTPLKRIALRFGPARVRGEAVITRAGLEGGAVYALLAPLREAVAAAGEARPELDLRPDLDLPELTRRLAAPRRGLSLSNFLRRAAGLPPVATALLREAGAVPDGPAALAAQIKALPLLVTGIEGLERAISSAGGIALEELDRDFMLRRLPGVYAAGEMLDWEAPTGGYLLQAAFSTGAAAGRAVLGRPGALPLDPAGA